MTKKSNNKLLKLFFNNNCEFIFKLKVEKKSKLFVGILLKYQKMIMKK